MTLLYGVNTDQGFEAVLQFGKEIRPNILL
jgi:hypothetical protein